MELLKKYDFNSSNQFEELQIKKWKERYVDYRIKWEKASNMEIVTDFPLYIMLEQTFKCNLRCPSCIQGYQDYAKNYNVDVNVMSIELYKKILQEAKENSLASISMHLNDEPLLVSDIIKRVELAKEAGIMDIIMTTNGVLLDKTKIDSLIKAGLTHLLFSIDAIDEEIYNKVRPGGDFKKVIKNMKYAYLSRDKMFPIIRASFVTSFLNEHQIDKVIEFFKDKVDYVDIQTFGAYAGLNNDLKPSNSQYNIDNKISCNMPFTRIAIRANGDVLPCCSFYGYDIVVGNIYKNSIKEIWNSKLMNKLREDFKHKIYKVGRCKECMENLAI